MSTDENAALVRRYFDECVSLVNGPDREQALSVVDAAMADDFTMAYNNDAEPERGRARHKAFLVMHARSYVDDRWTIEALVADEEAVACIWRIRATHAESGNPIDVRAADFFRVADGRLAELRRFLDFADLERQNHASVPRIQVPGA